MSDERLTEDRLASLERGAAAYVRLRAAQVADRPCHGTLTRLRQAEDMQAALCRLREQDAEIERLRSIVGMMVRDERRLGYFLDDRALYLLGDDVAAMVRRLVDAAAAEREVQP